MLKKMGVVGVGGEEVTLVRTTRIVHKIRGRKPKIEVEQRSGTEYCLLRRNEVFDRPTRTWMLKVDNAELGKGQGKA